MKNDLIKILAAVAFVAMVAVNFLANSLPINGRTTGEVSNAYPNLFAPAGLTFAIWGVIYLLLACYVVYQFVPRSSKDEELLKKINPLFIATSLANICWIFAWHYDFIALSVVIMLALLFFLIRIADIIRDRPGKTADHRIISAPFGVYFGWITVAAIANITVFLVSLGWDGFGIADYVWAALIMIVGAAIGILRMRKDHSIAYGLVLVWAYLGILFKHVSGTGFNGQYPIVIATVIALLIIMCYYLFRTYRGK